MKRRFTSTKTSGICRVCGAPRHERRGQRQAEHTEVSHYVDPMEDIPSARRRELRAEWIAKHLEGNPVCALLGKRATLVVYAPGETIQVPRGRRREQVGGPRTLARDKLRVAKGVFDFSGQCFCFIEDDGVYWDIDADTAMNEKRLRSHLTFEKRA